MSIWKMNIDLEALNQFENKNMVKHLGIRYSSFGDDFLEATMPVDERTQQTFGILHGGASVVLAETVGSVAGNLSVDFSKEVCVGLSINSSHLKAVRTGTVRARAMPLRLGKTTQVWDIKIYDEKEDLINVSRLTLSVVSRDRLPK